MIDDAVGEVFDKGVWLFGFGYPGGARIDRLVCDGDLGVFDFPVARVLGFDFSFFGVKTAFFYAVRDKSDAWLEAAHADLAASYQRAIVRAFVERTQQVAE